MITSEGINEITQGILNLVSHVSFMADGKEQRADIYKSKVDGNCIKIYILIDDNVNSNISNINLISKSGTVLIKRPEVIGKDISKGLLLFFSINIAEVMESGI